MIRPAWSWLRVCLIVMAVVVVGGAAIVASTLAGKRSGGQSQAPWAAPAGYTIIQSLKLDDDVFMRLWADEKPGEICYLVEQADRAGQHRSDASSACSPHDPGWSWARGLGVIVLEVPSPAAHQVIVTGPEHDRHGPMEVRRQLVMVRDYWAHKDVELTVSARDTNGKDLAPATVISVPG